MIELSNIRDLIAIAGVVIALGYYIVNIRNQRESRQIQLFMNMYNQSFNNPQYQNANKKILNTNWNSYAEFKNMYMGGDNPDQEFIDAYNLMGSFYEGIGVLVKEGYLDVRLVVLLMSGPVMEYWRKNEPIIQEFREDFGVKRIWSETEYLNKALNEYITKHPELSPI